MSKVIIASDSSCDLSKEILEKYNIVTNPFTVNLGDNQYHDGVDITPDDIYEYHKKTGELPKTAAINMAESLEFFKSLKQDEDTQLIFFTLSGNMSGTYQYACLAAEEIGGVFVVDSKNLSTGVGLSVIKAAELAKDGKSAEEIVDFINNEYINYVNSSFIIDSLEYLHKGGRCSSLAALGANLLKLKPCIEVVGGAMKVGKKYRGNFENVLTEYVEARLANAENIDLERIFVTHAGCDKEIVENVANQIKKALPFKEVLITRAGATVSVHCGRNTLGILFVQKTPVE